MRTIYRNDMIVNRNDNCVRRVIIKLFTVFTVLNQN